MARAVFPVQDGPQIGDPPDTLPLRAPTADDVQRVRQALELRAASGIDEIAARLRSYPPNRQGLVLVSATDLQALLDHVEGRRR